MGFKRVQWAPPHEDGSEDKVRSPLPSESDEESGQDNKDMNLEDLPATDKVCISELCPLFLHANVYFYSINSSPAVPSIVGQK